MNIKHLAAADFDQAKLLLDGANLPVADLKPHNMFHFLSACLKNDTIIGVIGLQVFDKNGLLRSLAVLDAYRGRGIAHNLMDKMEVYAESLSVVDLYLLTTTAEGFFLQHGFVDYERDRVPLKIRNSAEFRSLCPSSAVCMHKILE